MMDDNRDDSCHRRFVLDDHIHAKALLFVVAVMIALVLLGLRVAPRYIEYFRVAGIPPQIMADFPVQTNPHQSMADSRDGVTVSPARPVPAQGAAECLERAAQAARSLNYSGTLVHKRPVRTETLRVLHLADSSGEHEKLILVEGPAREIVRDNEQIRDYSPDEKVIRLDTRNWRNAFPSLLPQQRDTLMQHYDFNPAETERVAGVEAQAYIFRPKDGLRYGHKLWADVATGLLVKAEVLDERGLPLERRQFSDIEIGARIDRDMVRPTFTSSPPDWQIRAAMPGNVTPLDTGWQVEDPPPGFVKLAEGYRTFRGKPTGAAHLVFYDGLVAVSVLVEDMPKAPPRFGLSQHVGVRIYMRQLSNHLVTVIGDMPGAALEQIAYSVAQR
jgi:sigma-E factor negative regulatory protein RseB